MSERTEMYVVTPTPGLQQEWFDGEYLKGSTEPWTQQLVAALAAAIGAKRVLETGTFLGHTTLWVAETLQHAEITTIDNDARRLELAQRMYAEHASESNHCNVQWLLGDAIEHLASLPDASLDFVFLDDDHTYEHVAEEVRLALRKVRPGGIICGHDVFGRFGLGEIFARAGGYCFDLPRLHAGWGLGVIQVSGEWRG